MTPSLDAEITRVLVGLQDGPRTPLADLAASDAPRTPGIYALWFGEELLYIGIAKQDPASTTNPQAAGVRGRLGTYLRARLTSDFVSAALLRFVVPNLTPVQLEGLAAGTIGVRDAQGLIKAWIGEHVTFSTSSTSAELAIATERHARALGVGRTGPPSFNPLTRLKPITSNNAAASRRRHAFGHSRSRAQKKAAKSHVAEWVF